VHRRASPAGPREFSVARRRSWRFNASIRKLERAMAVDPKVASMFRTYLGEWVDARARRRLRCAGHARERSTLHATGGLVADARMPAARGPGAAVSDAAPAGGPSGLSLEAQKRLQQLDEIGRRCARTLKQMDQTIDKLRHAVETGEWAGDSMSLRVFADRNYMAKQLATVSRGERVTVIGVSSGWWQVRTQSGDEGWSPGASLAPHLPPELSSQAGFSRGDRSTDSNWAGRG
jgi:hypothetical protein